MLGKLKQSHIDLSFSRWLIVILFVFEPHWHLASLVGGVTSPILASEASAYTLTIGMAGTGSGTVIPSPNQSTYPYGTVVTLTATPTNADSSFAGWSGDVNSTSNPLTVTMTVNVTLTATFTLYTHTYFPFVARYTSQQGQAGGTIYAVAAQDNYVYIGQGTRLVVLDRSNPAALAVVGQSKSMPGVVEGLAIVGHYAYVADGNKGGLRIFDIMIGSESFLFCVF